MGKAAIYTRISRDPTGEKAGVTRQEEDCRAKAAELGHDVVAVYSDNDTSAYSSTPRPGYKALLKAIEDGQVDVVLVWHTDRLYRRTTDLEGYIAVCQPRSVPTIACMAGPLDLATPSGRMVARQLAAVAQYESEQKGERQKRANLQRALQGRHFGTRRCFGYEPDGLTIRETEAEAIRRAYQTILDGGSLAGIARAWNAQGLVTPQAGNPWTGSIVGLTLRTTRLAGIRSYQRQVLTDADGNPVRGEWPPVVDLDTWQAVQAILNNPERKWPAQSRGLLSGVARCAVCDAVIHSGGTRNGRRRYRCSSKGGHAYREAAPIDDFVTRIVLQYLAQPHVLDQLAPSGQQADTAAIREQMAQVNQRRDGLVQAFTDGDITLQQLKSGQQRLAGQLEALEAQLPALGSPALAKLQQATDPALVWEDLDEDERRNVIDALLVVKIRPARTKEATYLDWRQRILNPDSLELQWKTPRM
ncbi:MULTISPECIES: recombinase family protein [unclassified Luteococcus]|uniref:recombinase family protein n=1 Tax=unclassified Luteococcus TaxID=2639923 RepID=UPI00313C8C71